MKTNNDIQKGDHMPERGESVLKCHFRLKARGLRGGLESPHTGQELWKVLVKYC